MDSTLVLRILAVWVLLSLALTFLWVLVRRCAIAVNAYRDTLDQRQYKPHVALYTLALLCACGCASIGSHKPDIDYPAPGGNIVSVHVGLNGVDPAHYNGWSGRLGGCVNDARGLAKFSPQPILLLDNGATWGAIQQAIRVVAQAARQNNATLVISISGHGGQIPDDNGDERDGLDETGCFWDGQVRDDRELTLIASLPPIKIILISDQCHSEGNFRAVTRALGITKRKPMRLDDDALRGWGGQLIQFAGCREAGTSGDTGSNGVWSMALMHAYKPGQTWRQWFEAAAARTSDQVPVWVEYGAVKDTFRNAEAWR